MPAVFVLTVYLCRCLDGAHLGNRSCTTLLVSDIACGGGCEPNSPQALHGTQRAAPNTAHLVHAAGVCGHLFLFIPLLPELHLLRPDRDW